MNPTESFILRMLDRLDIPYTLADHATTHSCEESAEVRSALGLSGLGSKNIVFHAKGNFYLVVTSATRMIRARNFKKEFGTKDIRFATDEELARLMTARAGSIPPFTEHPELPIYVDADIFASEYFLFNPGNPARSVRIATSDLRRVYDHLPNSTKYFKIGEDTFEIVESF